MSESKVIETNLVTAPARLFYKCNILWQLFVLNMPTDAKECRKNNWYCTVYTYTYRGKHVYRYSTSIEHNVTLKTSMHIVIACGVSVLFFRRGLACCWIEHTHLPLCVVPRTPVHTTTLCTVPDCSFSTGPHSGPCTNWGHLSASAQRVLVGSST